MEMRSAWLSYFLEKERFHSQIAADYGKWLLASILLLHGGGLLGIFSIAEKANLDSLIGAATALIAGLMLGLLAGFITWLNWLLLASSYEQIADHRVLASEEASFPDAKRSTQIGIVLTFWSSMIIGFASALFLPIAAWLVINRPA